MTGRMECMKRLLRTREEICSLEDLYSAALSNGRNDVSVLRSRGWTIDRWWTSHGDGPSHCHYQLVSERLRDATQLTLA